MKFIHCADLHLESPLSGLVDGKRRRAELVTAFRNMLEYGYNSGVTAVVIAGDLFDGEYVSNSVILEVADCFLRYPSVQFYLLQGNHDGAKPIDKLRDLTISNLHIFGSEWTYFYQENVCFCGAGKVDKGDYDSVVLDSGKYNCIVLHLDPSSDTYGYLDEKKLNALPVDYVALGHIHAYNSRKCGRGLEVNCGTLEARGFDETTETGFVLVDTTSTCSAKFIPSAIRKVHTFILDVTTCISTSNAIFLLKDLLVSTPKADYVNIVLTGELSTGVDVSMILSELSSAYFAVRIDNKTTLPKDVDRLRTELTLRGEFVRTVDKSNVTDTQKSMATRYGIKALSGEDVE